MSGGKERSAGEPEPEPGSTLRRDPLREAQALDRVQQAHARDRRLHHAARRAGRDLVAAVLAARAVGLSDHQIATAITPPSGNPKTTNRARHRAAKALRERIRRAKRKATHRGLKAGSQSIPSLPIADAIDHGESQERSKNMKEPQHPYRRRTEVLEEWFDPRFGPPPQGAGPGPRDLAEPPPTLVGDEDDDEDDEDLEEDEDPDDDEDE